MALFLTTEQPSEADSRPRRQMPRREVPYYHRHEHRKPASLADWIIAAAVTAAVVWCVTTFGGWPA